MKAIIKKSRPKVLAANLSGQNLSALQNTSQKFSADVITVEDQQIAISAALGETSAECSDKGKYADSNAEFLLFAGFDRATLNKFLDELNKVRPNVDLKAMYTPNNRYWSVAHLIDELEKEHKQMTGGDVNG